MDSNVNINVVVVDVFKAVVNAHHTNHVDLMKVIKVDLTLNIELSFDKGLMDDSNPATVDEQ